MRFGTRLPEARHARIHERRIGSAQVRVADAQPLGDARPETFNSSGLVAIPAGQSWTKDWYVQVLPTNAAGSTIFNHTVLTVTINGVDHKIRTPDVVVTVVA